MAGLGMLMVLTGLLGAGLRWRGRFYQCRPFLWLVLLMGPSGLIAILAGWFTTEIGRQPWVVYGLLRTRDAVSAHGDIHMSLSLLAFIAVYASVFGIGYLYLVRLIKTGPVSGDTPELAAGTSAIGGQRADTYAQRRIIWASTCQLSGLSSSSSQP